MKFKWTKIRQKLFEDIKRIADCATLLSYTNFNTEFKIHTNARNFQLVVFINQDVKTINFCSIKLTDVQMGYTVI